MGHEHSSFDDIKPSSKEDVKKLKKLESNAVKKVKERQRRSKMTETIQELRAIIPSCSQEKKLNQSLVMSSAVEYIMLLTSRVKELEDENRRLKEQFNKVISEYDSVGDISVQSQKDNIRLDNSMNIHNNIEVHNNMKIGIQRNDGNMNTMDENIRRINDSTSHDSSENMRHTMNEPMSHESDKDGTLSSDNNMVHVKEEKSMMMDTTSYMDVFQKYDYHHDMSIPDIFVNDIEEVGVWPLYPHSSVGTETTPTKIEPFNMVENQPFVYCECGKMCQGDGLWHGQSPFGHNGGNQFGH